MSRERGLVGIDIGASNIKCALGIIDADEEYIDMIAATSIPTMGISEGVVVRRDLLFNAIQEGIDRIKERSQCEIVNTIISISGRYFYTLDAASTIKILEGRVTHRDVLKAVSSCHADAEAQSSQGSYGVTHTLPQRFLLDHEPTKLLPWAQPALYLGLKANLIYGHRDTLNSIWRLERHLPAPLLDVLPDLLVQAEGLFEGDELPKEAAILDIGSATTKVLLIRDHKPFFLFSRFQGGEHLTQEIQRQLKIEDFHDAEQLKLRYGRVYLDAHERNDTRLPLQTDGPVRYIRQESLARILERALTENLSALRVRLEEAGVASTLNSGVVLTGGSGNIPGICSLAGDILQTRVTLGTAKQKGVKDLVLAPQFATVNGLIIAGLKRKHDIWFSCWNRELEEVPNPTRKRRSGETLWQKIKILVSQ